MLALNKIRWNNWRFKQSHLIFLIVAYALFSLWQYLTLLSSDLSDFAYYGISALLLTHNGFAYTAYIFLNVSLNRYNLFYFINKYAQKGGKDLDPARTDDFIQEIADQKADDDTDLHRADVYDMITVGKVSVPRMLDAFGQGIQGRFQMKSACFRRFVNWSLGFVYLLLLILYAVLVYIFEDRSKLGAMAAVAVVACDIFVALIFQARVLDHTSVLILFIFVSRVLVFFGGEFYWIYGYLVMYMIIGGVLTYKIAQQFFPFASVDPIDFSDLKPKTKAYVNIAKKPSFILLAMTVCLAFVIFLTVTFKPKGVGFGDVSVLGTTISYDAASFGCIYIVLTVFVLQCTYRTYVRKTSGISGQVYLYMVNKSFDSFAISMLFNYLILLSWTFALYSVIKSSLIVLVGVFLPAVLVSFAYGFVYYQKNDYMYL